MIQNVVAPNRFSLISAEQASAAPGLARQWDESLAGVNAINVLYSSPVWFEHLRATSTADLMLALVQQENGQFAGACPLQLRPYQLRFDAWSRTFARSNLRAASVMGCEPLLPLSARGFQEFFEWTLDALPGCDCVYLENIATDGDLWNFLRTVEAREYAVYLPRGLRSWHCLRLEGSYEQYQAGKSGKSRNKLRQYVRDLRAHGGGTLECERITTENQVSGFLEQALRVSEKSWQFRVLGQRLGTRGHAEAALQDLARRQLLRCYLLKAGSEPCAFAVGHQYRDVFHYVEVGFDESLASALSPGTVLLNLMIEDLFAHQQPTVLNFGVGDAQYKQRFGNCQGEDAAVLIVRKTLANRLRLAGHRAFHSLARKAKGMLQRQATK